MSANRQLLVMLLYHVKGIEWEFNILFTKRCCPYVHMQDEYIKKEINENVNVIHRKSITKDIPSLYKNFLTC